METKQKCSNLDPHKTKGKLCRKPRKKARKKKLKDSHPQLLTEGAERWQAEGRAKALVIFNVTPNWALLLKASHRHSGSVFSTVFRPEQQVPSGFFTLPLPVTYDRQSAKLRNTPEQSTAGAGAVVDWTVPEKHSERMGMRRERVTA